MINEPMACSGEASLHWPMALDNVVPRWDTRRAHGAECSTRPVRLHYRRTHDHLKPGLLGRCAELRPVASCVLSRMNENSSRRYAGERLDSIAQPATGDSSARDVRAAARRCSKRLARTSAVVTA